MKGAALLVAMLLTVAAPVAEQSVARLPDGRALRFVCKGSGSPTVLFESGWAADARAWSRVQPLVAARTRACAYDRAGAGDSDAGPMPRDGAAIARDLAAGLDAAGIAPPYVLVGHSMGGLYARHFIRLRPADVRGLVLADSSAPHQQARFEAMFGPGAAAPTQLLARARTCLAAAEAGERPTKSCAVDEPPRAVDRWRARLSELEALAGATSSGLDDATLPADMPVTALVAGRDHRGPPGELWVRLQWEAAGQSRRGDVRVIANSGHMMIFDRPDAIAEAVSEMLPPR